MIAQTGSRKFEDELLMRVRRKILVARKGNGLDRRITVPAGWCPDAKEVVIDVYPDTLVIRAVRRDEP